MFGIKDVLLAKNTNLGIRRLCILLAICCAVLWTMMCLNEYDDFYSFSISNWFTYLIGIAVAAFIPFAAFGIYWALPSIGPTRRGDLVAALVVLGIYSLYVYYEAHAQFRRAQAQEQSLSNFSTAYPPAKPLSPLDYFQHQLLEIVLLGLFGIIAALVAIKLSLWLWQGFRGKTARP